MYIQDPFQEYIRQIEPIKQQKAYIWQTAIGLQNVDGLKTSDYLRNTAIRHIEGEISLDEAEKLIERYYRENPKISPEDRTEEADKVSQRIAEILSQQAFSFAPAEYLSIHKHLFTGIYPHAGMIRDYNITKKEWVLDGNTVIYGSASELSATLEYDFAMERRFCYQGHTMTEIIRHLAEFVSGLWQIHVFAEGNTRTTAVFFILYLRTLGFSVTNEIFAENAWYFRNALVRANYSDLKNGICATTEYLERFLENLLCGKKNVLKNREMHLSGEFKNSKKQDIQTRKQDIEEVHASENRTLRMSSKTREHISALRKAVGEGEIFGRKDVMEVLGITASPASDLIQKMLSNGMIHPRQGYGKGRYTF